jgi:hypothetical protein
VQAFRSNAEAQRLSDGDETTNFDQTDVHRTLSQMVRRTRHVGTIPSVS